MKNWIELSEQEYETIWNTIYTVFQFTPSTSAFPSFEVPSPFVIYDVSPYLDWSGELEELKELYCDLENNSLIVFKELAGKDEYFYALNWQHDCYWVNPFLDFPKDEFDEWLVPPFPNGDYYFFLHKDFKWGYLGHPWEETIKIFGEELIQAFDKYKPMMFQNVLRKSKKNPVSIGVQSSLIQDFFCHPFKIGQRYKQNSRYIIHIYRTSFAKKGEELCHVNVLRQYLVVVRIRRLYKIKYVVLGLVQLWRQM
ncbi:hypothetical protein BAMA111019_11320 [Bacillus manliponensis]